MGETLTITATEFKAKCLGLLDQLSKGELDHVTITKRGRVVGVLNPPAATPNAWHDLLGCMRGTVIIPPDFDLTAPVDEEVWDAELGVLHR